MKLPNHFLRCGLIAYRYDPVGSSLILLHFLLAGILPPLETFVLERVVFHAEDGPLAALWIGILIAALVISLLNRHLLEYGTMKLTQTLSLDFEGDYAEKLHSLPFSRFENPDTYDAISRFSTPAKSTVEAYISLLRLSSYLITLGSYLSLFGAASPWSIPVSTALFAISMYFSLRETMKLRKLQLKQTTEERKFNYLGKLFTTREALKEMKLFDFSDYLLDQHQAMTGEALRQRLKITKKGFYDGILSQVLNILFLSGGISFLAWLAFQGKAELSQVVALATALPTLSTYASWRMPMVLAEIKQKTQVFEDYELVAGCPEAPTGTEEVATEPVIRFDNVFFTYPGTEKPVLKGFSATISPRENTAIAGVNGCGKSTLIKLILGLYTPDQGEITVGGIPVGNLTEVEKARLFTAVFQDFSIYQMPIRDNITLADDQNSGEDPDLAQAVSYASLNQTIEKLSQGLDSEIGQLNGESIQLSGGESQKIAIARGLYAQSQYLILDEPTAALDPKTECRMYEEFCEMFRLRSCIVISHRLATAKIADRILLIHDGQLAESGTHEELMNLNGRYAEMFRAQAQWYQDVSPADEQEDL